MAERILVVSNKDNDLDIIKKTLGRSGFGIDYSSVLCDIDSIISNNGIEAVLADYDFAGDKVAGWMTRLQEKKSRSCLILYGEKSSPENIAELIQKGAYGFIPRALLADRVYDTLMDGLENRKAFVEILAMMDEIKNINEKLEIEKTALGKRNRELDFINRLSYEVSYDLDWNRILRRIIDSGLLEIINSEAVSILYQLDSRWNFACCAPGGQNDGKRAEKLKIEAKQSVDKLFSICREGVSRAKPVLISGRLVLPLSPEGRLQGVLVIIPESRESYLDDNQEIFSTISNILSMSLDNAEKYQKVKKLTVRDGLTGIYNHMGFKEFMESEFLQARRYKKPLSLIMIDIDRFKTINDSLGHLAGDYVLRELVNCLKGNLRETDILSRYGVDEFALILHETDMQLAEILIQRALSASRDHNYEWKSEKIKVEVSFGIASVCELGDGDGTDELIAKADSRMYSKKRSEDLFFITDNEALPVPASV
ncbi:MAG: Diguanylate cyclase [Thermodesulfobacteriota bacterium]|nr:Diguanylate cyclase [Thermodesulfobacteriota bacterium]